MRDDSHVIPARRPAGHARPVRPDLEGLGVEGLGAFPSGDEGDDDASGREDDEQQRNADRQ